MEAGRELDALVAEKVLGYRWWLQNKQRVHYLLDNDPRNSRDANFSAAWDHAKAEDASPRTWSGTWPNFSTDIAAAWKLANVMRERWGEFHLDAYRKGWVCSNRDAYSRTHNESIDAEAKTAPLAICLAALKAVGVEVPANA